MICLGIESTAHTFGISIMKDKKILSNEKSSYVTDSGGIHPTLAKEHHIKAKDYVLNDALEKAKVNVEDIDLISFSQGPGLPPCLVVGLDFAKDLSRKLKIPLIGVNHCIAHLEIGRLLTKAKDPVLLYVSGANTQVIAYEGKKYRIFGETLDNGCGNFIDGFARHIGLGFPGGPKIAELAKNGKEYIELPYAVKGMDVSFAGLQTNLKQKYDSKKYKLEDLCYNLQETTFAMLLEISERAINHCQKKELLLGGGVCCNTRLKEMAQIMCKEGGYKYFCPENSVLVDNAAMIAWLGLIEHKAGVKTDLKTADILPRWRTDQVEVKWM